MQNSSLINSIPLSALFCSAAFFVVVSWEVGFRFGKLFATRRQPVKEQAISTTVAAILGLLGFLLGFTFNMASGDFIERRKVLINDVNAIETTYLRAGMIAEPERSGVRELLREYVDLRVKASTEIELDPLLERSDEIRDRLWDYATAGAEKNRDAITAQFVVSLNQLIDVNTTRTTIVFQHRIPDTIWIALYGLTILGIGALGYQNGLDLAERSPTI